MADPTRTGTHTDDAAIDVRPVTVYLSNDEHTRLLGWARILNDEQGWDELDEAVVTRLTEPLADAHRND